MLRYTMSWVGTWHCDSFEHLHVVGDLNPSHLERSAFNSHVANAELRLDQRGGYTLCIEERSIGDWHLSAEGSLQLNQPEELNYYEELVRVQAWSDAIILTFRLAADAYDDCEFDALRFVGHVPRWRMAEPMSLADQLMLDPYNAESLVVRSEETLRDAAPELWRAFADGRYPPPHCMCSTIYTDILHWRECMASLPREHELLSAIVSRVEPRDDLTLAIKLKEAIKTELLKVDGLSERWRTFLAC